MKKSILFYVCILVSCSDKGIYKESAIKIARSPNGVAATAHPLATASAVKILESGGNAMDAAVAAAFTLTVVEPTMNGLGGRTQILIYSQKYPFSPLCITEAQEAIL